MKKYYIMIYSSKQKLDTGNPIEFRIQKTDRLRTINYDLEDSLKEYMRGLTVMVGAEKKISKLLGLIYEGNTSYESLITDLQNCLKRKDEII